MSLNTRSELNKTIRSGIDAAVNDFRKMSRSNTTFKITVRTKKHTNQNTSNYSGNYKTFTKTANLRRGTNESKQSLKTSFSSNSVSPGHAMTISSIRDAIWELLEGVIKHEVFTRTFTYDLRTG